jgi:hypothetical protein
MSPLDFFESLHVRRLWVLRPYLLDDEQAGKSHHGDT